MTDEERKDIDKTVQELLKRRLFMNELNLVEYWKSRYDYCFVRSCLEVAFEHIRSGKTINLKYVDGIMYNQETFYNTLKVFMNYKVKTEEETKETEQMDWLNK